MPPFPSSTAVGAVGAGGELPPAAGGQWDGSWGDTPGLPPHTGEHNKQLPRHQDAWGGVVGTLLPWLLSSSEPSGVGVGNTCTRSILAWIMKTKAEASAESS